MNSQHHLLGVADGGSVKLLRRLVVLFAAFSMVATLTTPAGAAQSAQTEEAELTARETELTNLIGDIEATLADLEVERSQVLVDIDSATAAIEGTTDALEQLALRRREPAQVRLNMALERFVNGEPAQRAFSESLDALNNDNSPFEQQEVFGSVLEAAEAQIVQIDAQAQSLQASVPDLLATRTGLVERLTTIDSATLELRVERDDLENELAEVTEALAWYRNSANRSVLTGRSTTLGRNRAALVVKIDNVPRARPQAGINDADIVYVELVEGGATRYAAVFHSEDVGTVGPVRSMRTTDINLLRPLNRPLFANSGANQGTTRAVNASPLVNIGHATGAGGAYWRNNSRPAPHNLFSSTTSLRRQGSGGTPPEMFNIRRPGTEMPNKSEASTGVSVNYQSTTVSYTWNGSGWARSQDGRATVDTAGVRTAPETVIVRFTPYGVSPADRNSPEANVLGRGRAWIFTEGRLIRGSWQKPSADAVTNYFDQNGDPLEILPGRVWVELPKPGGASLR